VAAKRKRKIEAIGYMRTSSATSVDRDKDSEVRQRAAIDSYAKAAGWAAWIPPFGSKIQFGSMFATVLEVEGC
jgi:hypothetical protein